VRVRASCDASHVASKCAHTSHGNFAPHFTSETLPPGHILVFMPGLAMIDQMYHALYEQPSLDNL
jgi:hypothetical protein